MRARSQVPILMLTARDEEPDRIVGLEVGADDYLTKPFSPRELVARMKAILRRTEPQEHRDTVRARRRRRSTASRTTSPSTGKPVELTAKEFDLLAFFMANAGRRRLARPAARPRLGRRSIRAGRARSTCTSRSCAASSAGPT